MSFEPARPLEQLFASRSSIKWRRYPADVLPVFVAEMDFDVEPAILDRVAETLRNSDTGYLDSAGPLAPPSRTSPGVRGRGASTRNGCTWQPT
ncbi:hypothetical protein ACRAWC_26160 [Leifsonia sp. L25]|uniref:hypothetical protein n=1 Tax=Actinomycetes TaxID=1760 RepID=UPI003D6939C6